MVARCTNPNHQGFTYWGGRGIKVCDRWLGETGFPNFLEDMGEMPEWADSINRKNNDLGYCPENCEWSTTKEQANNKRNNRRLTYNGKTQTVSQWAEETGIPYQTLWSRLKLNWPVEKTLTTPVRGNHK